MKYPKEQITSLSESTGFCSEILEKVLLLIDLLEQFFSDPRESAKTASGKELLEALLLQYERYNLERGDNPYKADIKYLKTSWDLI